MTSFMDLNGNIVIETEAIALKNYLLTSDIQYLLDELKRRDLNGPQQTLVDELIRLEQKRLRSAALDELVQLSEQWGLYDD